MVHQGSCFALGTLYYVPWYHPPTSVRPGWRLRGGSLLHSFVSQTGSGLSLRGITWGQVRDANSEPNSDLRTQTLSFIRAPVVYKQKSISEALAQVSSSPLGIHTRIPRRV